MKNSTQFKIVGISNNIAKLQRVGGGFYAFAEDAQDIGAVGEVVEVLEKDYTPEGDLSGYQAMADRYDAEPIKVTVLNVQNADALPSFELVEGQWAAEGSDDQRNEQYSHIVEAIASSFKAPFKIKVEIFHDSGRAIAGNIPAGGIFLATRI
jgi:hypothetical protein